MIIRKKIQASSARPNINITPLIDVLLVLLIIFMVISPIKPHKLDARLPDKTQDEANIDPLILVVSLNAEGAGFKLNQTPAATTADLSTQLHAALDGRPADRRAVFVKAPEGLKYGRVVDAIDLIKNSGGEPIGLQLEGLN